MNRAPRVIWQPQKGPQEVMLSCPYPELLYGGAAGGGKTDCLLGDYAAGIESYRRAWKGVIFRRSYPMLEEIESRSLEIFGPAYGERCYSIGNKEWKFPNGAVLQFRFIDKDKDVYTYQGQQYVWIGWDELTQWPTPFCYTYLFTRQRSAKGAPCFTRATSNPGGPGHLWVKERFKIGEVAPTAAINTVMPSGRTATRVFIPAKVTDNHILIANDPMYLDRLEMLSDPVMRRALRDGDWNIFAGQAFPEWNPDIHVVDDGPVPEGVTMWRACDWGFEKPYSVLWFYADFDGNITVCNEMYGQGDQVNTGSKEAAASVRERIETLEEEMNWWVPTGYLDPQCWAMHNTEPSIYEHLGGPSLNWQKWAKGPNSRKNQKAVVHDYLKVVNGKSRLRIMKRCKHLIRTLPTLPLSERDPEDIDTDAEDHSYDTLRGGLVKKVMTRDERRRIWTMRTRHRARRQRVNYEYGGW